MKHLKFILGYRYTVPVQYAHNCITNFFKIYDRNFTTDKLEARSCEARIKSDFEATWSTIQQNLKKIVPQGTTFFYPSPCRAIYRVLGIIKLWFAFVFQHFFLTLETGRLECCSKPITRYEKHKCWSLLVIKIFLPWTLYFFVEFAFNN